MAKNTRSITPVSQMIGQVHAVFLFPAQGSKSASFQLHIAAISSGFLSLKDRPYLTIE